MDPERQVFDGRQCMIFQFLQYPIYIVYPMQVAPDDCHRTPKFLPLSPAFVFFHSVDFGIYYLGQLVIGLISCPVLYILWFSYYLKMYSVVVYIYYIFTEGRSPDTLLSFNPFGTGHRGGQ